MKSLLVLLFVSLTFLGFAQSNVFEKPINKERGLYFYWGYNWDHYTKSDISFSGNGYNFTLSNVVAKDHQSHFLIDTYFNPTHFTVPQYNFRLGYFFNPKWDLSLGVDHMKYVVQANQSVDIDGYISETNTKYDHDYNHEQIIIAKDFLKFEHTDGLNYINLEMRHNDNLINFHKVKVNLIEGFGIGGLLPKTNATLLNRARHDDFHIAGYGCGAVVGLNIVFFDRIFFQSEFKAGYINMPDVRTTASPIDRAHHSFFYDQYNFLIGGKFKL